MPTVTETAWPFDPPPGAAFRLAAVDSNPPHTPHYQLVVTKGQEAAALAYLQNWIGRLAQAHNVGPIVAVAARAHSPGHAAQMARDLLAAAVAEAEAVPGPPGAVGAGSAGAAAMRAAIPFARRPPPAAPPTGIVPAGNAATDAAPPAPDAGAICQRPDCGAPFGAHEAGAPHPHLGTGCGWYCAAPPPPG